MRCRDLIHIKNLKDSKTGILTDSLWRENIVRKKWKKI